MEPGLLLVQEQGLLSYAGIVIDDPAVAAKVKHVLLISVLILILGAASQILYFALFGGSWVLVFGLAIALSVPACGYYGAKQRSKSLLGCFACCNCCIALGFFVCMCLAIGFLQILHDPVTAGSTRTYEDFINQCWSDMAPGCDQMKVCDFGPSCPPFRMQGCTILGPKDQRTMLYAGARPECTLKNATARALLVPNGTKALCVHSEFCEWFKDPLLGGDMPADMKVTDADVWWLIILLLLTSVPGAMACCMGAALYRHPFIEPQHVLGSGAFQRAEQAATPTSPILQSRLQGTPQPNW